VLAINESEKYLGITTKYRLNFEDQITLLIAKISRSIGVLYKLRHTFPVTALRNLYYSIIHPHCYAELLFGVMLMKNIKKNFKILHNKAVRLLTGTLWRDHITPCYLKMIVLKLNELYMYDVAKLMHKHARKKLSSNLFSFFFSIAAMHTRTIRLALSDYNSFLPRCKTQKLQNSFR